MHITLDQRWPEAAQLAQVHMDLNEVGEQVSDLIDRLESAPEQAGNKGETAPQRLCMVPPKCLAIHVQSNEPKDHNEQHNQQEPCQHLPIETALLP